LCLIFRVLHELGFWHFLLFFFAFFRFGGCFPRAELFFNRGRLRLPVAIRGVSSEEGCEVVASVFFSFDDFLAFFTD
jgi:hypothetical protein